MTANAMTHTAQFRRPSRSRQRGAVLAVAMMFLVVITLLGITAISSTTLEEKMAANARDYNTALQAAEAALRDAEADILGVGVAYYAGAGGGYGSGVISVSGSTGAVYTIPASSGRSVSTDSFKVAGDNGMWLILTGSTNVGDTVSWTQTIASGTGCAAAAKTVVPYGCYTGATALAGVNQQPRYLIELSGDLNQKKARVSKQGVNTDFYYLRVTARGWGSNPNTQVTLQTIFLAPI